MLTMVIVMDSGRGDFRMRQPLKHFDLSHSSSPNHKCNKNVTTKVCTFCCDILLSHFCELSLAVADALRDLSQ